MEINKNVLKNDEKAVYGLRTLYGKYGYTQFKMNKFEEYDLYVRNKDFLVSDSVITFTDTMGRLMALKPDVTLSIIKNTKDVDGCVQKLYYNENVYRISKGTHDFKEIMQAGLECIGDIDLYNICEVIMLARESLNIISPEFLMDISHLGLLDSLTDEITEDSRIKNKILSYVSEKNFHSLRELIISENCKEEKAEFFIDIVSSYGKLSEVIDKLKEKNLSEQSMKYLSELIRIYEILKAFDAEDNINFDFSIVNNMNYYNGIVFQGFVKKVPESILSGGQYDKLMSKMGKKSKAIGFAVYLDLLERMNEKDSNYDADIVLLYDKETKEETVVKTTKMLMENGKSVIALKSVPENIKCKQLLKIGKGGIEIIETDN